MYVFKSAHATILYAELLKSIIEKGELEAKTRDLMNINLTLTDPTQPFVLYRKKHWKWCFMELFDRMSPLYLDDPSKWNPGIAYEFRPAWKRKLEKEGGTFDYSYGEHYKDQVQGVIDLLNSKKTDREGIINVWESRYLLERNSYQRRPCTLVHHYLRRDDKLYAHTTMRSNDVVNLLPFDLFHHTFLQRFIALKLNIGLGYYSHTASHMYYPKRRESKGRKYFDKLKTGLRNNWLEFQNMGYCSKLSSCEEMDEDFLKYYDGAREREDFNSPLIRSMVSFISGKKEHEFKFL